VRRSRWSKSMRFVGFKSVSQAIMNVDLLPKKKFPLPEKGERTHTRPETPKMKVTKTLAVTAKCGENLTTAGGTANNPRTKSQEPVS